MQSVNREREVCFRVYFSGFEPDMSGLKKFWDPNKPGEFEKQKYNQRKNHLISHYLIGLVGSKFGIIDACFFAEKMLRDLNFQMRGPRVSYAQI